MEILRGDRVELRQAMAQDIPAFARMLATPEIYRWWTWPNMEQQLTEDDSKHKSLAITAGGEVVGMISWYEEKSAVRYAGMDLFIDPAYHRRGYASDALRTLIHWLIDTQGHHRLVIDPHLDNIAAIACYEKVGFRRVGVMHQYISVHDGPWLDAVLMELLAKNFT